MVTMCDIVFPRYGKIGAKNSGQVEDVELDKTRSHDRKAMDFYPAWSVWRWHVPWSSKGNLEIPGRLTNVVDAMNKDVPGIWYTKMSKKWYNYPENED